MIEKHAFRAGCSSANATHNTHTTSYSITEMDCVFNDVQHIINGDEVTQANDYSFVKGKIDTLRGLKENVIVGRLIPAGTGATKVKWQEEADLRDASLANESKDKDSSEKSDEKQLPAS